jgi:hypothetical protein
MWSFNLFVRPHEIDPSSWCEHPGVHPKSRRTTHKNRQQCSFHLLRSVWRVGTQKVSFYRSLMGQRILLQDLVILFAIYPPAPNSSAAHPRSINCSVPFGFFPFQEISVSASEPDHSCLPSKWYSRIAGISSLCISSTEEKRHSRSFAKHFCSTASSRSASFDPLSR